MKRIVFLFFIPLMLAAQTPKYPAAIAGDDFLKVAKDQSLTSLSGAMTDVATSFSVTNGAMISANSIVTIGSEQIAVCNVVGNTVSVGHSACPNADGRGFGGTSAAAHNNGALVWGYIAAWYHNALSKELQAVETALGTNLGNVLLPTGSYANPAWLTSLAGAKVSGAVATATALAASPTTCAVGQKARGIDASGNALDCSTGGNATASDYTFTQTPGGSLAIGSNTITLTPCPLGVNGSDTLHSVWISGGTGSAEAVPITGGTCTSGAASGTIIVTAAGTHTGAWTVSSISGGLTEAICSLTAGGTVEIGSNLTLLANVTACGKQVTVEKHGGVTISGSYTVLGGSSSGTNPEVFRGVSVIERGGSPYWLGPYDSAWTNKPTRMGITDTDWMDIGQPALLQVSAGNPTTRGTTPIDGLHSYVAGGVWPTEDDTKAHYAGYFQVNAPTGSLWHPWAIAANAVSYADNTGGDNVAAYFQARTGGATATGAPSWGVEVEVSDYVGAGAAVPSYLWGVEVAVENKHASTMGYGLVSVAKGTQGATTGLVVIDEAPGFWWQGIRVAHTRNDQAAILIDKYNNVDETGLWRVRNWGWFSIERNTAAGRDFSTFGAEFNIDTAGNVVLGGKDALGYGAGKATMTVSPGGAGATLSRSLEIDAIDANMPQITFKTTDGGADEKLWNLYVFGGALVGSVVNDAENAAANWIIVRRSGATVSSIELPNIPTSCVGKPSKAIWSDSGTLKLCP